MKKGSGRREAAGTATRSAKEEFTVTSVLTPFLPAAEQPPNGGKHGAPSPGGIRAEMTEITPDLAQQWIRRHEAVVSANRAANGGKARDNRVLRIGAGVEKYARDMKAGRWHRNGESVKIAWDGTIVDGQHRLYACVRAQVPFWSVVVTGVGPEAQDTVDTGLPRRLSDQLAIANEKNAPVLASVTRWSLRWLHGIRSQGGADGYSPTQTEMLDYLAAEPRLRDAAAFAARARAEFKPVRATVWAMAWMVLHGADGIAAEVFLGRAVDGADLPAGHPVLALRNRMANAKVTGERLTEHEQLAMFCLAWNAFREDRRLSRLQLPAGGLNAKNFPEPR
jgi:hypothetical protein